MSTLAQEIPTLPTHSVELQPASGPQRAELTILLFLCLLGLGFRAWRISTAGLNHFDEGVYAFSALGLTQPGEPRTLFPGQAQFSPPVFFSLVGLAYRVFGGPSDTAAILVNVVLGSLTIPMLWWVGRSWFGAGAGIAAAALLAFSDFHILLSRTALTDAAFAAFFLLSLAAIVAAVRRGSIRFAALAGLAVGLAWNTKYHGWFALLIGAAAWLALLGFTGVRRQVQPRSLLVWIVMAVTALLCYLPWLLFISSQPGGYEALARHQWTFLSRAWLHNLIQHAQMQFFFDGWLSRCAIPAAVLCAVLVSGRRLRATPRFLLILTSLCISGILIGGAGAVALLTLFAVPALFRQRCCYPAWVALTWLAVWFFSTPLYQPYARLALPFLVGAYLAAGFWMARAVETLRKEHRAAAWQPVLASAAALGVVATLAAVTSPNSPWRPSRSMWEAASAMLNLIPRGSPVFVIDEPALAFYLHLAQRPSFERVDGAASLEQVNFPAYVVTGFYAKRAPRTRQDLQKLAGRLTPLGTFSMDPNDVRLMDDLAPRDARRFRSQADDAYHLTLYRLAPAPARSGG